MDIPTAYAHPNSGGLRPVARIDVALDALATTWRTDPDLRLGQIVSNAAFEASRRRDRVFDVEDGPMTDALRPRFSPEDRLVHTQDLCGRHIGLLVSANDVLRPIVSVTHHRDAVVVHTAHIDLTFTADQPIRLQDPS